MLSACTDTNPPPTDILPTALVSELVIILGSINKFPTKTELVLTTILELLIWLLIIVMLLARSELVALIVIPPDCNVLALIVNVSGVLPFISY